MNRKSHFRLINFMQIGRHCLIKKTAFNYLDNIRSRKTTNFVFEKLKHKVALTKAPQSACSILLQLIVFVVLIPFSKPHLHICSVLVCSPHRKPNCFLTLLRVKSSNTLLEKLFFFQQAHGNYSC